MERGLQSAETGANPSAVNQSWTGHHARFLQPENRVPVFTLIALFAVVLVADAAESLVLAERGDLPIILVAPHGGSLQIPDVPPRTNGVVSQDSRTLELTRSTADQIEKLCGHRPYVVAAKFHRKYLDVNRPVEKALEHPDAMSVYREYHGKTSEMIREMRKRFPRGCLLIDMHGQKGDPDFIHRGTANGVTVLELVRRAGVESVTGTNSVLGGLAAAGFKVFPPNTPPGKPAEDRRYNGGFTVRTYGSHQPEGVDALQLEFGTNLRRETLVRERLAKELSHSIVRFGESYLDWTEK